MLQTRGRIKNPMRSMWIIPAALSARYATGNINYHTPACFNGPHSNSVDAQKICRKLLNNELPDNALTHYLQDGFSDHHSRSSRGRVAMASTTLSNAKRSNKNDIAKKSSIKKIYEDDSHRTIMKMEEAELIEKYLSNALENVKNTSKRNEHLLPASQLFPSVRQCNAALATFGDAGDFKRALKLFMQMRKSTAIIKQMSKGGSMFSSSPGIAGDRNHPDFCDEENELINSHLSNKIMKKNFDLVPFPPKPTLVSYSTMMSRAVSLGKPRVALRLWNLMCNQPNFYTNLIFDKQIDGRIVSADITSFMDPAGLQRLENEESVIVPDVICCNTLMNAYAKLGDHTMARSVLNSMLGVSGDDSIVLHEGIPPTAPTVVTYNTLADACKVAGELGEAIEVLDLMYAHAESTGDKSVAPDARTYTILISTCARKSKQQQQTRDIRSGGERDPDMAFSLLERMINDGIKPNGVTYCALIDVCSRCRRVDLALNGLRIMLRQKEGANLASSAWNDESSVPAYRRRPLLNEVGAWTAAINACGKDGRTDTASRLFRTMQRFGVKPNSITCGCLSDCLLKSDPIRITETLEVLRYMKKEGLVPDEVMYTSLMDTAMRLAEQENRNFIITKDGLQVQVIDKLHYDAERKNKSVLIDNEDEDEGKAIELFTEVMRCLIGGKRDYKEENSGMLLKVFLVFQEMKNAGSKPDIACYNSLLRACALAGDVERAQDVLSRIQDDGLQPNDASWRQVLRAAAKAKRSDVADTIWDMAVTYDGKRGHSADTTRWVPSATDVELLISVHANSAKTTSKHNERIVFHRKIINIYEGVLSQCEDRGLDISIHEFTAKQRAMLTVLRAAVSFATAPRKDEKDFDDPERSRARDIACEIAGLETLQGKLSSSACDGKCKKALQLAQDWLYTY